MNFELIIFVNVYNIYLNYKATCELQLYFNNLVNIIFKY